jgi:hypothetical protein
LNVEDFVLEAVARVLALEVPDDAVSHAVAAEAEYLAGSLGGEVDA